MRIMIVHYKYHRKNPLCNGSVVQYVLRSATPVKPLGSSSSLSILTLVSIMIRSDRLHGYYGY